MIYESSSTGKIRPKNDRAMEVECLIRGNIRSLAIYRIRLARLGHRAANHPIDPARYYNYSTNTHEHSLFTETEISTLAL